MAAKKGCRGLCARSADTWHPGCSKLLPIVAVYAVGIYAPSHDKSSGRKDHRVLPHHASAKRPGFLSHSGSIDGAKPSQNHQKAINPFCILFAIFVTPRERERALPKESQARTCQQCCHSHQAMPHPIVRPLALTCRQSKIQHNKLYQNSM